MAIATSNQSTEKDILLGKINALVWVLEYLSATGAFPSKEYLALKYPELSREKLLFYFGCQTEEEVAQRLDNLKTKLEYLQQTLVQEDNLPEEIKTIPKDVANANIFAGKSDEEVKKILLEALAELKKEPSEEELKLIKQPEKRTIFATLVDPHSSFSPTYNQAAEILAQAGLIDENGEPKPEYKNLLANPQFKAEVEKTLRKIILSQELESQIIALLDEEFKNAPVPHDKIQKEFNFAKKQIASLYAQEALSKLEQAGTDIDSLSLASQEAKQAIAQKIEKDKEILPHFFESVLAGNLYLANNDYERKRVTDELVNATFQAMNRFSPAQNVWLSLGDDLPRVAAAHYHLDENGKLQHHFRQYWAIPKTPQALREEAEEERNDQEVLLAALYKETSTIPNPNVAKYVGQERPKPKTVWPYYVGAPLYAGWFITDPAEAVAAIPYGTTAIASYIGAQKIKEKVDTFKTTLQPFLNPAAYLHQKYSQTVGKLIFQKIPASALRLTPLYKNYDIKGIDGKTYSYAEFRPARFLRNQTTKVLEKFAGNKTASVRYRVFTRAKENITPQFNPRTKKAEKKHHGLLGVIIGVALVDVLAGAIWEFAKDRVVMLAKIEKALGPTGRIGKSAFSLNTLAGASAGFLIGTPLGLAGPFMLIGGLGGWGFQAAKDFAKDQGFLLRQAQREQLLAEGKMVSPWERTVTRVGRLPRFLARYPLAENFPLKGATFGYLITGGNPLGALVGASIQGLWANRAVMGSFAKGTLDDLIWKSSGAKYTDLGHFIETGVNKWPLWQRVPLKMLAEFRYLGRWGPGAGIGGTIGFLASGGNPLGAVLGAMAGGTAQMATAFMTRTTISFLSSAWEKYVLHNLRMLYLKNPWMRFTKGGIAGLGIGLLLAYLGVPIWLALPAGIIAGVGAQWAIEKFLARFFGRAGVEAGAEVAEAVGARTLAGGLRLFVGKLIGAFTGIGTAFAAIDLGRGLFKYTFEHYFKDYETWKKSQWFGRPSYLQYRIEKWFVQSSIKVLNFLLWPWDRFWNWFFGPFWSSFLGPLLTNIIKLSLKLYDVAAANLGFLRKAPWGLGKAFDWIGDRFKDAADWLRGGAQAILKIITGILGALIQFFLGGDVAEAALAAAIGLALAGSFVNSQTISSAFIRNPEEMMGAPGQSEYISLEKTVDPKGPLQNSDLPKDLVFTIKVTATKEKLVGLEVTDSLKVTKESGSVEITKDKNGKNISPIPCPQELDVGQSCDYSFTVEATSPLFEDSIVTNTVKANASVQIGPTLEKQQSEKTVSIIIGNPPIETPHGWPTTGTITQGPNGPPSTHLDEAIDIAGKPADPLGDPVYATFNADVTLFENDLCGTAIILWPSNRSFHAVYCHLSARKVNGGDRVTWGQLIGYQGYTGWTEPEDDPAGTHLHYDFDESLPMAPPNIPEEVPQGCSGNCRIVILSAP